MTTNVTWDELRKRKQKDNPEGSGTAPEVLAKEESDKKKEDHDLHLKKLMGKYNQREQEYAKLGSKRAGEDQEEAITDILKKTTLMKTTFNISLAEQERFEKIISQSRVRNRLGYRHLVAYALDELAKMENKDALKAIEAVYNRLRPDRVKREA